VIAFAMESGSVGRAALPFGVDEICWAGALPDSCHVYVCPASTGPRRGVARYDMEMLDDSGDAVCLVRGFTVRLSGISEGDLRVFTPVWERSELGAAQTGRIAGLVVFDEDELRVGELRRSLNRGISLTQVKHGSSFVRSGPDQFVIDPSNGGDFSRLLEELAKLSRPVSHILQCWPLSASLEAGSDRENIEKALVLGVHSDAELLKAWLGAKGKGLAIVHVIPSILGGLVSGLGRTARLEAPDVAYRVVEMKDLEPARFAARALAELADTGPDSVLETIWVGSERRVKSLRAATPLSESPAPIVLRPGGVYVITGGLGGLGRSFAAHLLRKFAARVILVGRSELAEINREALQELKQTGGDVDYSACDVTRPAALSAELETIVGRFGRIDGIFHAAGCLGDALLPNVSRSGLNRVLRPKVLGAMNLDRAARSLDLEFLVFFSSLSGEFGNIGQAGYAAANAFLDRFAADREERRKRGLCRGKTISINWPLWEGGGMKMEAGAEKIMRARSGYRPISVAEGISLFERVLAGAPSQLVVVAETKSLGEDEAPARAVEPAEGATGPVEERLRASLGDVLAAVLKLPREKLKSSVAFDRYGLDSMMMLDIIRSYEQDFGTLPKTLFFECRDLSELTAWFMERHRGLIEAKWGSGTAGPSRATAGPDRPVAAIGQSRAAAPAEPSVSREDDIAIVGVSGRYPEADDLDEFWKNLVEGRDCVREIPADRWAAGLFYDPDPKSPGKVYSKWGGFLRDVAAFDPLFFNIAPRDAGWIDPQERLFLETAWSAVEDAGYDPERLQSGPESRVGVFAGVMWGEYQLYGGVDPERGQVMSLSSSYAAIANRVSFVMGLQGPSIALDTMCSSSLTAIHLACESLRRGECAAAIAGGVNVSIHPNKYAQLSQGRFAASDGRCRSFGAGGDGYVPGEGVGAVLLKPLRRALADGDTIRGVIKGSSVNHGGRTTGYTVPNPKAHAALIGEAWRKSGSDIGSVGYIEAHGTGTALGDPVEIGGLAEAFRGRDSSLPRCAVGSVKSNIGHLESAAGIAALTKVLMQLKHGVLVPSLHSEPANPNIDFVSTPFAVQRSVADWPRPARGGKPSRRLAGISSFGAGGANAHLVVEEAPERESAPANAKPWYLATLSAKRRDALGRQAANLLAFVERGADGASMEDICHTLNAGRGHYGFRCAMVVNSLEDLRERLREARDGRPSEAVLFSKENVANMDLEPGEKRNLGANFERLSKLSRNGRAGMREVLLLLARAYASGATLDWEKLHDGESRRRTPLPTYPFSRDRYWVPEPAKKDWFVRDRGNITASLEETPLANGGLGHRLEFYKELIEQVHDGTLSSGDAMRLLE
jgi:3-oxoacyl-(acyl-carrier-protein) synthase/NAD(P)-dependent dehydrogenase (short-subunit alcohol dehydrogenase family)